MEKGERSTNRTTYGKQRASQVVGAGKGVIETKARREHNKHGAYNGGRRIRTSDRMGAASLARTA